MPRQSQELLARIWRRARRASKRAGDRVRGLPLRVSERKLGRAIPPGRLIHRVAGTEDVAWFLETGARAAHSIHEALAGHELVLKDFGDGLDFGCGVGRVIRHWDGVEGPRFHGSDYEPELIDWCRAALPFARFGVNGLDRPLADGPGSYDLIDVLSVFTHLSGTLERFWMDGLARVLKPGGYLLITTHGDHYLPALSPSEQDDFRAVRAVVRKAQSEGGNDCAVFHPEASVRETLARGFEVLGRVPKGALGNPGQDVYLLRKPVTG